VKALPLKRKKNEGGKKSNLQEIVREGLAPERSVKASAAAS
jgi:hypothetical protein